MAKRKASSCPECGGMPRGRGYAHKPGCSRAKGVASKGRKRRAVGRPRQSVGGGSVGEGVMMDLRRLRGMSVDALLDLNSRIQKLIHKSAPILEKRIAAMQEQLKSIKGR